MTDVRYSQPSGKGDHVRRKQTLAIALVFGSLAVACGGKFGSSLSPSATASVPPAASPTSATGGTGTTINASGSAVPTTSPGITGSVTQGTATLAITGDLQTTQQGLPLASPTIYAPVPGAFALNWAGGAAGIAVSGDTFIGTQPTSDTLRLTFFVHASSGTRSFSSADGACQVSVTQADPTAFAGTFSCADLPDTTGSTTVSAQGAFSASG